MSTTAVAWAMSLPLPPRTSSAKALLIVLSFMSRLTKTQKLECFPSVGYLVAVTGQNRKTVIANLDKLERWGLLSDTGRRMGVTRQVIVYRVHMRAKISTRLPHGYSKAKKRRPKNNDKCTENASQASRERDTERVINMDKKSFRAPARAPTPVRSAAVVSPSAGAGDGRKRAMTDISDLIERYLPNTERGSTAASDRPEADPDDGGVA